MKNLSKSRSTLFRQCSKALWLSIYKPEEASVREIVVEAFQMAYLKLTVEVIA